MIHSILLAAVPLLLTSLGGLFSLEAGALNISLEGNMTAGAFVCGILLYLGLPLPAAAGAALATGAVFGALLALVHLKGRAHLFIAGLGINLLVPALTGLLSTLILGHKGSLRLPDTIRLPFSASGSLAQTFFVLVILTAMSLAVLLIMRRTSFGRKIRSADTGRGLLVERGVNPQNIQFSVLIISSAAAALAGALLTLRIGAWVPGISAGRGWIALVIIWMGFRNPWGMSAAACFFSGMEILAHRLQGYTASSATLALSLPYLSALAALILAGIRRSRRQKPHRS